MWTQSAVRVQRGSRRGTRWVNMPVCLASWATEYSALVSSLGFTPTPPSRSSLIWTNTQVT